MDSNITKKKNAKREYIYRKRIPYGIMNFVTVRRDDCYYVDKTDFIEEIERSNMYFFYIRPRRFGKSLTLSCSNSITTSIWLIGLRNCLEDCISARILHLSIIPI